MFHAEEAFHMARKGSGPNKSNQIYCTVREEIITGKYPGGTFLTESDLCEQFAVSRTPVREALIRLSQDRLVELIPNRGAFVPHITLKDISELCQLRAANEGLAAYLLAKNTNESIVKKLLDSVEREEQLLAAAVPDPALISKEDFIFHTLVAQNCGNKRLTETLALIDNQMKRLTFISADDYAAENSLRASVTAHRTTAEAIRDGDAERAQDCLYHHWWGNLNGYVQRSLEGRLSLQL